MTDPFQNPDAAGAEFIARFADAMDQRQAHPDMERIVAEYLAGLSGGAGTLTVEVGCGAGAVSRRLADHMAPGRIIGFDASEGFIAEAKARAGDRPGLSFVVADGASLPVEAGTVDYVVQHTVLTHVPDPALLIAEAVRVLKPGGRLIICDADFSKATLRGAPNDPLAACSDAFVSGFVTDAYLTGKLRALVGGAGLTTQAFRLTSRTVTDDGMRPWVEGAAQTMMDRGEIGADLGAALLAEHDRRVAAGTLYGYQAFVTLIARKP